MIHAISELPRMNQQDAHRCCRIATGQVDNLKTRSKKVLHMGSGSANVLHTIWARFQEMEDAVGVEAAKGKVLQMFHRATTVRQPSGCFCTCPVHCEWRKGTTASCSRGVTVWHRQNLASMNQCITNIHV